MRRFAVGLDYGTNSARALLVDIDTGEEAATRVFDYPTGRRGVILDPADPHLARQHPGDYVKAFEALVAGVVRDAARVRGFAPDRVVGLGVDTTGSTPMPVGADGVPLAFRPRFRKNPHAQAWLWKDHTAWREAAAITALAREMNAPYLARCGGAYSSEWFWSKIWHCRRVAPDVFRAAHSWVELADFVPAWATDTLPPARLRRSICAAGHKAMFADAWGGLPAKDFLRRLHPDLARLRDRLYDRAFASDRVAGHLSPKVARRVGLPAGLPVAVGAFDCHHGAVGAGIRRGVLVKTLGTSTCDCMVVPEAPDLPAIPGICGMVPGSIVPGMVGLEAGQSAVGDLFAWFVDACYPAAPGRAGSADGRHRELAAAAARLAPGASGLLALDWNNGNRTVLVDQRLTGLLVGQTLHTTPAEIYRALIEATAFGARTIVRRLEESGVRIREVVCGGGIAEKNAFLMQTYADILGRPMKVSRSPQTCALGAALFGAVAAGAHRSVAFAQKAMTGVRPGVYRPNPKAARAYAELYALYAKLHDAFGGVARASALGDVMKRLLDLKDRAARTR